MSFLMQINYGDTGAVLEYCGSIRDQNKDECFEAAGQNFRDWLKPDEDVAAKCAALSRAEYILTCRKGAGLD